MSALLQSLWPSLLSAAALAAAQRPSPHLLLDADDFARIDRQAKSLAWAASARDSINQFARNWPADHNTRYGLSEWQLPPEGGQWTLWYVCPVHGVSLQFQAGGRNVCPVDKRNFTGWPYDQVIYARRHSDNANAARDNGLAYRFTGDLAFARAAAKILLTYADVYLKYPIKDVNNKPNATSGGRVSAQTLDEAIWLIPIAWGYDLIADSGALSAVERSHIEQDLLRAAAGVVSRNDAKISNWQSWHNAGIGAVAFALDDQALINKVIDGPSGFRFQMRESVLGDGAWYEGAWGYHFFALDAHVQLAEMAARAGIDLYAEAALRKMFTAPLQFAMPDWKLPPFNDSGATDLFTEDRLYEKAYARYGDPLFASVLGVRSRGRDALFWGAATLPKGAPPALASAVFPDSGNAILRAAGSDHYLAAKFGPSGGWHGHYDKLGFVSYARGGAMAVDPGTQSYAAPTHDTWDKVTLAHNTVVVDQKSQAEATGTLLGFAALPGVSAVRASAGPAYKQASLERALIVTAEYALDSFTARSLDGADHQFDWIYHNFGQASTMLPLAPYRSLPSTDGYQHLSDPRAAATSDAWQVAFDMNEPGNPAYGSIYTDSSAIKAAFQISAEQSAAGKWSGRMSYDFSGGPGYILFGTPTLAAQPAEVPAGLSLMFYGDGSGHILTLRLYDITDERFVYTVGPVNWIGWRQITLSDPALWSHYLGNNDGIFDTPVKSVAVELRYQQGGPAQGALFVDDIALEYPGAGRILVADFERTLRSLRLWMLGAAGTTVVTGNGLGPDLLKPVPFAMARRRGKEAQFVSLLEPYGEAPAIQEWRAIDAQAFEVKAGDFEDRLWFGASGQLRYVRRNATGLARLAASGVERLEDSGTLLLEVPGAVPVQVDYADAAIALTVNGAPNGDIRVFAPAAVAVSWNGSPVEFRRDGDFVLCAGPR